MSVFEILYAKDVNAYKEERDGLSYLTWSYAWAEVKKLYPDAVYEIEKFDGLPYVFDPNTGYMVYTKVTIEGMTHEMWLPVMDSKNKAMKNAPYTYTTRNGEKTVEAATMFDINKTIMRCLVKNLAMFGLGLYIYAGEDLPEKTEEQKQAEMITELKQHYAAAGGADFDKWVKDVAPDGITPVLFASMKATLLKQINKRKEEK